MAHDLVETATFDTPITVPDPGDPAQAGVVAAAFSATANRAQFLKQYTDQVATGVPRIQGGISFAVMKDTVAANFEVFFVADFGLYCFYDDAGAYTEDGTWVFDSNVTAGAHWFHSNFFLINNGLGGFAAIGPNFWDPAVPIGKIREDLQTNRIIDWGESVGPAGIWLGLINETAPTLAPRSSIRTNVICQPGDVIHGNWHSIYLDSENSTSQSFVKIVATQDWDGAGGGEPTSSDVHEYWFPIGSMVAPASRHYFQPDFEFTVWMPGRVSFDLYARCGSAVTSSLILSSMMQGPYKIGKHLVFRP